MSLASLRLKPFQTYSRCFLTKWATKSTRKSKGLISPVSYDRNNNASDHPVNVCLRSYATKNTGNLKRPSFKYSGDLTMHEALQDNDTMYSSKGLKDMLENAPEAVQRLNSLEYASGRAKRLHRLETAYDRTEELFGQNCNLEQRISKLTVGIRLMIPHCIEFPKNKYMKSQLVEKIQMRKKQLKYLRQRDYERFYWLLRELRIRYIPEPQYKSITRKFRRKRAARNDAVAIRQKKLQALKDKLAAEREEFDVYKADTLAQIERDIEELKLDKESFEKILQREAMTKQEAKDFNRNINS